jgi:hypothetical protein
MNLATQNAVEALKGTIWWEVCQQYLTMNIANKREHVRREAYEALAAGVEHTHPFCQGIYKGFYSFADIDFDTIVNLIVEDSHARCR